MGSLSKAKPKTGNNKKPKYSEQAEVFAFPDGKWVRVRMIGPMWSYAFIWFNILTNAGKKTSIPKLALNYDPAEEEYKGPCPYYDSGLGRAGQVYIGNIIIRDFQKESKATPLRKRKNKEAKAVKLCDSDQKFYIKDPGSKSVSPVRAYEWPPSVISKLIDRAEFNEHKGKKYPLDDPKYGRDFQVKYNSKASGTDKWQIELMEGSKPLTDEEKEYLLQPLSGLESLTPDSEKDAQREIKGLSDRIVVDEDDEKKGKSKDKGKNKDKYIEDDSDAGDTSDAASDSAVTYEKDDFVLVKVKGKLKEGKVKRVRSNGNLIVKVGKEEMTVAPDKVQPPKKDKEDSSSDAGSDAGSDASSDASSDAAEDSNAESSDEASDAAFAPEPGDDIQVKVKGKWTEGELKRVRSNGDFLVKVGKKEITVKANDAKAAGDGSDASNSDAKDKKKDKSKDKAKSKDKKKDKKKKKEESDAGSDDSSDGLDGSDSLDDLDDDD